MSAEVGGFVGIGAEGWVFEFFFSLNLSKSMQSLCIFYFYFLQGTMYCLVTRIKRYPDEFIDFRQKRRSFV